MITAGCNENICTGVTIFLLWFIRGNSQLECFAEKMVLNVDQNEHVQQIKDYLSKRFQLPEEQVADMIPAFIKTLEEHLVNLENALQGKSLLELGKSAHTIKGALLNLGLHDCAEVALKIEKNGKAEDQRADYHGMVEKIKSDIKPLFD